MYGFYYKGCCDTIDRRWVTLVNNRYPKPDFIKYSILKLAHYIMKFIARQLMIKSEAMSDAIAH